MSDVRQKKSSVAGSSSSMKERALEEKTKHVYMNLSVPYKYRNKQHLWKMVTGVNVNVKGGICTPRLIR